MPRYFISADDGEFLHHDEEGQELPDDEAARKAILDALPDMARDKLPNGDKRTFTATARDEQGNVVYEATLTLEGGWGPGRGSDLATVGNLIGAGRVRCRKRGDPQYLIAPCKIHGT